ncbi:MAG: hypothetical protein KAK04_19255, partial [Cyclobacteriaceae bacterium]|nr:hypothetical protein [Cyclobacteriaceae bacterium]
KGLNYIFNNAVENPPDGGIYLTTFGHHSVYNTGIAMMAIAAARCPTCQVPALGSLVDGYTFEQVLQVTVDFFVAAQNPDGGWRYHDNGDPSDNSNTGFAVLGLLAAEGAGIAIDPNLKPNLSAFIDEIQDDTNGGSWYRVDWSHPWINTMKTGNLLFEMAFVGNPPEPVSGRAQFALEYIQNHWNDLNDDPGWRNNYLAMYCLMKGFVSMDIETIDVGGSDVDWYDDFVLEILGDPANLDPWPLPGANWTDVYLSSIFALLTLEKITPVPYIIVNIDVKPTSCPNPLNRGGKGVLPVAILGTADFDVATIDPPTVNIGDEVYPLRWSYEDVATPYLDGMSDPVSHMDCTTEGPDGYRDLVLHFSTPEIADLFSDKDKGNVIIITVDGQLVNDGLPIIGEDVMVIVK